MTDVTSGAGTAYTFISHCCLPAFCACYVLDPMLSVFLQCQCLIAASGFQFEDSKVVIRGFNSHDRQYNDQMKTMQSISQKTKEWVSYQYM
jgi:hypothetical protein